jgi:hypothetical protein
MLAKCTKDYYTVCPSDFVLRKPGQQSCLIALFFGKMDIVLRKCKRLILNEDLNQFGLGHPTLEYWVYSLSSPTQVTVKCQEAGPPQNYEPTRQITLSNTGILPDSSSCYIYAENFKLLPHSLGRLTVNLNKTHIVLPNVDDILNVDERELLQNHSHTLADLRPVENIIERATSRSSRPGLDVNQITTV